MKFEASSYGESRIHKPGLSTLTKRVKIFLSMPWRHTWRRCIAPLEASGQPQLLCSGKELRYPFNRKLGRPQGRSGRFGEEENALPPTGIRTPIRQTSDCNSYAIPAICPYIIIMLLLQY